MIGSRSRRTQLTLASLTSTLVALAACGGSAERAAVPGAKSPDATSSEPMTIEEAEQQIAAARAELAGHGPAGAGGAAADSAGRFAPAPAAPPPPPAAEPSPSPSPSPPSSSPSPPASDSPSSTSKLPSKAAPRATTNADDRCGTPCRALVSMRRAVTALCRMTGNDDTRCVDARRTLTDSQARIAPCSC
jgi:hypothetical protein